MKTYFPDKRIVHMIKLLFKKIFLIIASWPMPMRCRKILLFLAGVHFAEFGARIDIGNNVLIDRVCPEKLTIGRNVVIAANCTLLTHFLDPSYQSPPFHYNLGEIILEDGCFLGVNCVVCNSVVIGKHAIIGAGSIVTKSVPPYEIWAGNPARKIGSREAVYSTADSPHGAEK